MVSSGRRTDVFVIGGGPAGLAAAIAARQRGFSVTVADGTAPPIDKACGEGLMPATLAALSELGVAVQPDSGFRFRGIRFLENGRETLGEFPQGSGLGIRRTILHDWLIHRAEQCGVRLLWQTPVAGISKQGVRLAGEFIPARWIVGADGSSSRVRRWSGLDLATREKVRYAMRRHYRVAPWSSHVEIHWANSGQAYVTPISHEEVCVVVMGESVDAVEFDRFLQCCTGLRERLAHAQISSRERGAITLMHTLSAVHVENIALIGDASGGVDAITGEGLRLAFRQAVALAAALEKGDLRLYARAHRALMRKPTRMGNLLLMLGRNSRLRARAMTVLAQYPEVFARLLALHSGDASWENLFSAGRQLGWRFLTT